MNKKEREKLSKLMYGQLSLMRRKEEDPQYHLALLMMSNFESYLRVESPDFKEKKRAYYAKNKKHICQKEREKYHSDLERSRELNRKYARKHMATERYKNYRKNYYEKNKDKILEKQKMWRRNVILKNPQKLKDQKYKQRYGELAEAAKLLYELEKEIKNGKN